MTSALFDLFSLLFIEKKDSLRRNLSNIRKFKYSFTIAASTGCFHTVKCIFFQNMCLSDINCRSTTGLAVLFYNVYLFIFSIRILYFKTSSSPSPAFCAEKTRRRHDWSRPPYPAKPKADIRPPRTGPGEAVVREIYVMQPMTFFLLSKAASSASYRRSRAISPDACF